MKTKSFCLFLDQRDFLSFVFFFLTLPLPLGCRKVFPQGRHFPSPIAHWSHPPPFLLLSPPCLMTASPGYATWTRVIVTVKIWTSKRYIDISAQALLSFFPFHPIPTSISKTPNVRIHLRPFTSPDSFFRHLCVPVLFHKQYLIFPSCENVLMHRQEFYCRCLSTNVT